MSMWLDKKYITLLGPSLRNFSFKTAKCANFSCPICGDSKTDKSKARGYLFVTKNKKTFEDSYVFKCHNCDASRTFKSLLEYVNKSLYDEYILESLKDRGRQQEKKQITFSSPKPTFKKISPDLLVACNTLPSSHISNQYLDSRKLPNDLFYWTEDFREYVFSIRPDLSEALRIKSIPRLCLQIKDRSGDLIGVVGRDLDPNARVKYATIKFDPESPKLFGLDRHDKAKPAILVEGPIDSLLLPNSLAICGGSMSFDVLDEYIDKSKTYICLDNEPRKKETVDKLYKFVNAGYKVVVWQNINSSLKDINDMIVKGNMSKVDILKEITKCSYSGTLAIHEINKWKRV